MPFVKAFAEVRSGGTSWQESAVGKYYLSFSVSFAFAGSGVFFDQIAVAYEMRTAAEVAVGMPRGGVAGAADCINGVDGGDNIFGESSEQSVELFCFH